MIKISLEDLYRNHQGKVSDKWSNYLSVYDRIFADYRVKPINLLEIGIQNGGSLEIWSNFFPLSKSMVGCDINPDCAKLTYEDPRIFVVVGDANLEEIKANVLNIVNIFDIIVDDGSHRSGDIVKSFSNYFPQLANDGLYVVEDLNCSYWQDFEGGLYEPYSSIAFFKKLADILNFEHWGSAKTRASILTGFFDRYKTFISEEALAEIHSVEFVNSMCIVRKRNENKNVQGERLFSGTEEDVVVRGNEVRDLAYSPQPQGGNPWTSRSTAPEEDTLRLEAEILSLNIKIADSEKKIFELTALNIQVESSLSWRMTAPLRFIKSKLENII